MILFNLTIIIAVSLYLLVILYALYQLFRNQKVYNIRINWIFTDDIRYNQYNYQEMYTPSKSNYYGLQLPRDKVYKVKVEKDDEIDKVPWL